MKFKSTVFEEASGKFGNTVMRKTKFGQIAAKAPRTASTPRRSENQFKNRGQLTNIGGNYRLYAAWQEKAFEEKPATLSEYNMMVKVNWGISPVYLPKRLKMQGGVIVAPYIYCMGSMSTIGMTLNQAGVLVTDISLGSLMINNNTTVAQFSAAVIGNNSGYEEKDQITMFLAHQTVDALNVPRATMNSWKVVLDLQDETKLLNMVSSVGFATVNGHLGMGTALKDGGASWAHTRNTGNGNIKISTQYLFCVNELLARYQSPAALKDAANSYGGINRNAVYLDPASSLNYLTATGEVPTSSTPNGSGSSSGSSSSSVAAPTFSGETQFTESTTVTMTAEDGAEIRYTIDGSTPTATTGQVYSSPLTLSETTIVKAVAVKDGVTSSVTNRTYTKTSSGDGPSE